jgi:hypothetical protein
MIGFFNPLNAELNPIRHLLALTGVHHFVDVSRIKGLIGAHLESRITYDENRHYVRYLNTSAAVSFVQNIHGALTT